ncbi:HCBT2 [Symbiodinium necroappetens]|uniref:HCBT2 protein n=1 Tax=Symbiodinium necroappetens TaxID=1628268 RepID=A0A812XLU1_9DINO|nr:HCBT2 [Symbiodinium necroappetens]
MMRLCSTPLAHCFVLKSVPHAHLLQPVLRSLLCVMAALACVVPLHAPPAFWLSWADAFIVLSGHSSCKVWHGFWIPRTSLDLLEATVLVAAGFHTPPCYTGPLPPGRPFGGMLQRKAMEAFKTTGSEQWPPRLCQWLAASLVHTCRDSATTALVGDQTELQEPPRTSTMGGASAALDAGGRTLGMQDTNEQDEDLHHQLRRLWQNWLEAQDLGEPDLLHKAKGQTPHVFPGLAWVPNYAFVEEHPMAKMTLREFKERYGENRAIASLAVIVEDELKDKKPIIHDATHGVRVNHSIKCRDKIRAPGAREKKQLLREMIDEETVAFSVVGDIAKAHRRDKHQASEHGFLGCQLSTEETIPLDPDSQLVYVNLVETFGLSKKRADWLVEWLEDKAVRGKVSAKDFAQGLGRLGFAAIALDWERGSPGGYPQAQESWAPWAFAKGDPNKVIAVLPWVPEGSEKKTSRVAIRGYTDNKSNEALLRRAMTTKFPSTLRLMETAEELSAKNGELQFQWVRRDLNQLADDLTNENFDSFIPNFGSS